LTALLAILAALLLLLATLFFVAIGLRVLLVLLVGVVSHFPSPLSRHAIMPRHGINSSLRPDVSSTSPGRGNGATGARRPGQPMWA